MGYYDDIYQIRMNRYGSNPKDRLEGQRRANFEKFLRQSPHMVIFSYKDVAIEGVLEPKDQDNTQTIMNLLVRTTQHFKIGDIITINEKQFLVYYWTERQDSGYNKYAVMKLTHTLEWKDAQGMDFTSLAYMYGPQTGMKPSNASSSPSSALYFENANLHTSVIPYHSSIEIGTYITVAVQDIEQHFTVSGFDAVSTPGVQFVTLDPTAKRVSPEVIAPTEEGYFWSGGIQ